MSDSRPRHHQISIYEPLNPELSHDEIRDMKKKHGLTWHEILELGALSLE